MTRPKPVIDGGYGWVIVLGCCLCNFLLVGASRSMGVLYDMFLLMFNESAAATATFLSIYNTLRMVLGPVASSLCVRFGCRVVVMTGGLLVGAGFMITCQASDLIFLNFSMGVVAGVGAAMIFTPPYIIVGEYFDKKKGRAMSLSTIGAGLGTIALGPLQGFLIQYYGSTGTLLIVGALELNLCVAGALFRPQNPHTEEISMDVFEVKRTNNQSVNNGNVSSLDKIPSDLDTPPMSKKLEVSKLKQAELFASQDRISLQSGDQANMYSNTLHASDISLNKKYPDGIDYQLPVTHSKSYSDEKHLENQRSSTTSCCTKFFNKLKFPRSVEFCLYLLNITTMPFSLMTPMLYLPSLAREIGADEMEASWMLSILGISDICGRFAWGFLFDIRAVREKGWRTPLFALTGVLFALSCCLLGLSTDLILLGVFTFIYGVFQGGYHSQRMTVLGEILPPTQIADAVGWSICFQGVGNMLSSPFLGYVKDVTATFKYGYFIGGGIFVVSNLATLIHFLCNRIRTISK